MIGSELGAHALAGDNCQQLGSLGELCVNYKAAQRKRDQLWSSGTNQKSGTDQIHRGVSVQGHMQGLLYALSREPSGRVR